MHHVDLSQTGGVRDKTNADVAALRSEISRLRQLVDELQTQLASSTRQLECARSDRNRVAAEVTSATAESAAARQRSEKAEAELLQRCSSDAAGEERLRHCLKELDRLRERLRESEEGETAQRQRGQAEQEVAMELRKESER